MNQESNSEMDKAITNADILRFFKNAEKEEQLVGMEVEKIGMITKTCQTASYTGKNGYLAILGRLYEELGWEITEKEARYILQLRRRNSWLNLESDGRIELAGAPHQSIHGLAREFRIHQGEITEIADTYGIVWLGIGYHPVSANKDIEDIPVDRKNELSKYLTKFYEDSGNDFGLAYYKKTSGIHVSIDYSSEDDFALKSKTLFRLAPIFVAIFANSPFSKGEFTGYMSYRKHVTNNTDIPNFHISQQLYESEFRYQDWIDHVTNLEIIFLRKANQWIYPKMKFSDYLKEGFEGYYATLKDFEMQLKCAWLDTKLKQVIEVRCFDSVPPHMTPAAAAIIKGLCYDQESLEQASQLVKDWDLKTYNQIMDAATKDGLSGEANGIKILDLAKQVLELAEHGLKRNPILDYYNRDESHFLEPIKEYVFVKEKSPAEYLVEQWQNNWNKDFFKVMEWCQY